jgi:hypothetical protein
MTKNFCDRCGNEIEGGGAGITFYPPYEKEVEKKNEDVIEFICRDGRNRMKLWDNIKGVKQELCVNCYKSIFTVFQVIRVMG